MKKQGGNHSVEEAEANGHAYIADSHGSCKELMVPVLIDRESLDMELETDASLTIIPNSATIWYDCQ